VALDKKSLQVKYVCIEDESGDVTTISLFDVQINLDIPHAILSFELPEGVKINRLHQP
jgi:outer membrane lipoprotein-sorting protein